MVLQLTLSVPPQNVEALLESIMDTAEVLERSKEEGKVSLTACLHLSMTPDNPYVHQSFCTPAIAHRKQ